MLANGLKSNQYFVSKTTISTIFLLMLLQFLNHDTNLKPLIKRKIGKLKNQAPPLKKTESLRFAFHQTMSKVLKILNFLNYFTIRFQT